MTRRDQPARFAGLQNGDLVRHRDPKGARIIITLSLLLVLFCAVKVFAFTVEEVRAMPRFIEGIE